MPGGTSEARAALVASSAGTTSSAGAAASADSSAPRTAPRPRAPRVTFARAAPSSPPPSAAAHARAAETAALEALVARGPALPRLVVALQPRAARSLPRIPVARLPAAVAPPLVHVAALVGEDVVRRVARRPRLPCRGIARRGRVAPPVLGPVVDVGVRPRPALRLRPSVDRPVDVADVDAAVSVDRSPVAAVVAASPERD